MERDDVLSRVPARIPTLVLAALLSAFAFAFAAASPGLPMTRTVRYEPLAIVSGWGGPLVRAEIGRIRVPENRASGSAREIELAFVRIPSTASRPGAPIVWLSGGPGESGIADLDTPVLRLFLELRRIADVIVVDQRGTGLSVPRLDCPGAFHFPLDAILDRPRAIRALEDAAVACASGWRARGVDLAAYGVRESTEDIEDIRLALGAPRVSLLGGSYGTHVALEVIRAHDDRVDRAVLLGVVGPDQLRTSPADLDAELAEVSRLAAAGPNPSADLVGRIRSVRERLAGRRETGLVEAADGSRVPVALGVFDLDWYVRSLLASRESIAHLPAFLDSLAAGDYRELAAASARWREATAPAASRFIARCASGSSAERSRRIERERETALLSEATDFAEDRICRAWGIDAAPEELRAPIRSDVQALLVSGSLDGTTPAANAAEVMAGLSRAEHLVVEGGAHALLGFEDQASRSAVVRFFERGGPPKHRRIELASIVFERDLRLASGRGVPGPIVSPFGGGR